MRHAVPSWARRLRHRALAAVAAPLAAAVVLGACSPDTSAYVTKIGAAAPAYSAQQMDGTPVSLADHRGDVVLLNVWATWCKPCREEIPALDSLHREFSERGLVVAGVSIDVITDTGRIAGFARDLGASYALWLDPDDRVSSTFRAIGVPSTYLVDREGVLRWTHMGAVKATDARLRAVLDSALGPVAATEE
jgi:cytochrome c biogenesis protein CcmG, thiol:disulfide interchange protein DsbE